jgi:predicted dehydrogenase
MVRARRVELQAPIGGDIRANVLIVGLGKAGMLYDLEEAPEEAVSSHAQAFSFHRAFEVVAGVDLSEERRKQFAVKFKAPSFADAGAAAQQVQPVVAVVASPTEWHLRHVAAILKTSRPRVILCEKPLAWSPLEARCIVELCAEADCRLVVNYQRRTDRAVRTVARLIAEGGFQPPFRGVCWYSKGALHSSSHFVDLTSHWFGPPSGGVVTRAAEPYGLYDAELDFRLRFAGGDVVFLAAGSAHSPVYRLELIASNGILRYDGALERYTWAPTGGRVDRTGTPEEIALKGSGARAFLEVANEIARMLEGEPTVLCDGVSASRTVSLLSRLIEDEKESE